LRLSLSTIKTITRATSADGRKTRDEQSSFMSLAMHSAQIVVYYFLRRSDSRNTGKLTFASFHPSHEPSLLGSQLADNTPYEIPAAASPKVPKDVNNGSQSGMSTFFTTLRK